MKEIDDFIAVYNEYLLVKTAAFDDVKLIVRTDATRQLLLKNQIDYFLRGFTFPMQYNYSGFCFIQSPVEISDDFINFASHIDYSLEYIYCVSDGKVYLWCTEYDRIEWACAGSLSIFFEAMAAVMRTKIMRLQSGDWSIDTHYLKGVFKYCLSLNGDKEEYEEFYDHILGMEPEESSEVK